MSRLATAMHAPPPRSLIRQEDLNLQHHQVLLDQYAQCMRAFKQDPSPRLAVALKQLDREIKRTKLKGETK